MGDVDVEVVLRDAGQAQVLLRYLESKGGAAFALFSLAVDHYRDLAGSQERLREAKRIFDEFIHDKGRLPIKLPSKMYTKVVAAVDSGRPSAKIFEDAQEHALSTIDTRYYDKFLKDISRDQLEVEGVILHPVRGPAFLRFLHQNYAEELQMFYLDAIEWERRFNRIEEEAKRRDMTTAAIRDEIVHSARKLFFIYLKYGAKYRVEAEDDARDAIMFQLQAVMARAKKKNRRRAGNSSESDSDSAEERRRKRRDQGKDDDAGDDGFNGTLFHEVVKSVRTRLVREYLPDFQKVEEEMLEDQLLDEDKASDWKIRREISDAKAQAETKHNTGTIGGVDLNVVEDSVNRALKKQRIRRNGAVTLTPVVIATPDISRHAARSIASGRLSVHRKIRPIPKRPFGPRKYSGKKRRKPIPSKLRAKSPQNIGRGVGGVGPLILTSQRAKQLSDEASLRGLNPAQLQEIARMTMPPRRAGAPSGGRGARRGGKKPPTKKAPVKMGSVYRPAPVITDHSLERSSRRRSNSVCLADTRHMRRMRRMQKRAVKLKLARANRKEANVARSYAMQRKVGKGKRRTSALAQMRNRGAQRAQRRKPRKNDNDSSSDDEPSEGDKKKLAAFYDQDGKFRGPEMGKGSIDMSGNYMKRRVKGKRGPDDELGPSSKRAPGRKGGRPARSTKGRTLARTMRTDDPLHALFLSAHKTPQLFGEYFSRLVYSHEWGHDDTSAYMRAARLAQITRSVAGTAAALKMSIAASLKRRSAFLSKIPKKKPGNSLTQSMASSVKKARLKSPGSGAHTMIGGSGSRSLRGNPSSPRNGGGDNVIMDTKWSVGRRATWRYDKARFRPLVFRLKPGLKKHRWDILDRKAKIDNGELSDEPSSEEEHVMRMANMSRKERKERRNRKVRPIMKPLRPEYVTMQKKYTKKRLADEKKWLGRMVKGAAFTKYNSVGNPAERFFTVSPDGTELRWQGGSVKTQKPAGIFSKKKKMFLGDCQRMVYGSRWSQTFRKYNHDYREPWFGITLVFPNRTVDFIVQNDAQSKTWFLGLQSLCPMTPEFLTKGAFLWRRAMMKARHFAWEKQMNHKKYLLRLVDEAHLAVFGKRRLPASEGGGGRGGLRKGGYDAPKKKAGNRVRRNSLDKAKGGGDGGGEGRGRGEGRSPRGQPGRSPGRHGPRR